MGNLRDYFGSLFSKRRTASYYRPSIGNGLLGEASSGKTQCLPRQAAETFKKGDIIGSKYEVHGVLGKGGFGIVYLAYNRDIRYLVALKTFRDELFADVAAREAFKKEAQLWVKLGVHPFIVTALLVEEAAGFLFVEMDYIAPDDHRRVNLRDHLLHLPRTIDTVKTLEWSIQFCHAMEHARANGMKAHCDIKPSNILITQDGILQVIDFGLAMAAEKAWQGRSLVAGGEKGRFGYSIIKEQGRKICGTPGYIPPEIYRGKEADIRSDIYSFGLVLWQMATGSSTPPFSPPYHGNVEKYLKEVYELQMSRRIPRVESCYWPMIERSLNVRPSERYKDFGELRGELEPLFRRRSGRSVKVPEVDELIADPTAFWNSRGISAHSLGRYEEAIRYFDKALGIDRQHGLAWTNKGATLYALKRLEEAIGCYDRAIEVDPENAKAWLNKAGACAVLGRDKEAVACCDKAIRIDPKLDLAWTNKGSMLHTMDRNKEAIRCFEKAIGLNPRQAKAWLGKAFAEAALGQDNLLTLVEFIKVAPSDYAEQAVRELEQLR